MHNVLRIFTNYNQISHDLFIKLYFYALHYTFYIKGLKHNIVTINSWSIIVYIDNDNY